MSNEKQVLLEAMQEAGAAILQLQTSGFTIATKANNDIVTKADLLANDILKSHLTTHFPAYGWLSEECADDPHRLTCNRVWIVDPIDGTKEYAAGIPEYAISVALVENGQPILASVFNPATNELFYAEKNQGAWCNNKKLNCNYLPSAKSLLLLASRSEYNRGEWERFQQSHQVKQVGSIAYKLALIAAGEAHATFSLDPKNEWDIAAGVLLVIEAGGKATDQERHQFVFNRKEVLVNGIVAANANVEDQLWDLIGS